MLHHITSSVADSVEIGEIFAIATGGKDAYDGYYLVELTGCPYTEKETDGSLNCKGDWLYQVPGAMKWFTKSTTETTIDMVNVVATLVVMDPISPSNRILRNAKKVATKKHDLKISDDSHNSILDEIIRRERLEYDPSRVLVGDENEDDDDSDSDSGKKKGNIT